PQLASFWKEIEGEPLLEFIFKELNYRLLNVCFFFANLINRLNNKRVYSGIKKEGTYIYNLFNLRKTAADMNLTKSITASLYYWKSVAKDCETIRDFLEVTFDILIRNIFIVSIKTNSSIDFLTAYKYIICKTIERLAKKIE
ncbi:hypothetical protein H311_04434, partial [Anncaliia algerae PRA109]